MKAVYLRMLTASELLDELARPKKPWWMINAAACEEILGALTTEPQTAREIAQRFGGKYDDAQVRWVMRHFSVGRIEGRPLKFLLPRDALSCIERMTFVLESMRPTPRPADDANAWWRRFKAS